MKKKWSYIFCLFIFIIYAQDVKILRAKDSIPIQNAILKYQEKTFISDINGKININKSILLDSETITISHLAYKSINFTGKELKVKTVLFLEDNIYNIEEVNIYTKKEELFLYPEKSNFTFTNLQRSLGLSANLEAAIFLPYNSEYENYIIKGFKIEPLKGFYDEDNLNMYLPFEVNLCKYDTINKIPSNQIFKENIIAKLNEGEKYINIIFPKDIEFPKEGICVLLKAFSASEYKKISNKEYPKISFKSVSLSRKSKNELFFRFDINNTFSKWESGRVLKIKQCYYIGLNLKKK